jgi:hypothetical protein
MMRSEQLVALPLQRLVGMPESKTTTSRELIPQAREGVPRGLAPMRGAGCQFTERENDEQE